MRCVLLSLLLSDCLAAAEGASTLPQHLINLSGRKAGICSMPRCGDGKLAVELAQNSKLLVHALSENPAETAAARKAADAAGLLNRTLYVEEGSVSKNPLADWCADLLVIADASDANLDQIAQQEVRRVLSPYRGVAVVGRVQALGTGLTRARLEAWLKGLGVFGGKIVEDTFGLWAVATMPPLAGGDDWSHYAHGPDQNRFSKDDALKWPYLIQWAAKPYYDGKFDIAVAAGGRLFRANVTLAVDNTKTDGLIARSAYNGNVLWKRKTADDFGTFGSLIVATPEAVYVKDGNGVLCLAAETGAELKRISLSDDPQSECRWLMLQDGILVTVLGPRPQVKSLRGLPNALTDGNGDTKDYGNTPHNFGIHQNWFQEYDQGTELVAHDAAAGKELWRLAAQGIDPAKTALAADRVFFYAERSYASCLDLKTGKTLWKTAAPITKNPLGTGWSFTFMITERVGALASPDVYLINSYKDGHYQAFAAKEGRILWGAGHGRAEQMQPWDEASRLGKQSYPILVDGKTLDREGVFRDPLTGKPAGEKLPISYGGCGSFCISTHGVHGMTGTVYDRDVKARIVAPGGYMKAACLSGVIAADGTLFSGHGNCSGCMEWIGHLAFCPSGGFSIRDAASTADRLLSGESLDKPGIESTPLDWTTYRANNSRSGSSSAMVSGAGKVLWTWTPDPPFDYNAEANAGLETQSTQAICVGERVCFGTSAGIIRCLDRKTGKELWSYPTAGRILSSPTFWEDKVYAGSGDGRVYCLKAEDGSLLWRYRVAPVERRIMVYGHLMSSWPVNANVLVQPAADAGQSGAVAYASAGLIGATGGSLLCALDARTGKPRWETRFADESETSPSATGQMAWYNGKLWLHVGDSGVLIVDPATGKAAQAIDFEQLDNRKVITKAHMRGATYAQVRGQDIGILPGGWVVLGGRQFYLPSNYLGQPRDTSAFLQAGPDAVPLDATGYPNVLVLTKGHGSDAIPVWDAKDTLLFGTRNQRPVLCSGLGELLAAQVAAQPFDPAAAAKNYWNSGLQNSINSGLPAGQQRQVLPETMKSHRFYTPLLAGNAVIFLSGDAGNWHVVAVSRTDPALLWDIRIPAQPVLGGLSQSRAGDVLAPLVDGRVVCIGTP
ncbi:MAG: PQQ-binding-like beta-propeller repeat protein [Planctomycetota bacterium]